MAIHLKRRPFVVLIILLPGCLMVLLYSQLNTSFDQALRMERIRADDALISSQAFQYSIEDDDKEEIDGGGGKGVLGIRNQILQDIEYGKMLLAQYDTDVMNRGKMDGAAIIRETYERRKASIEGERRLNEDVIMPNRLKFNRISSKKLRHRTHHRGRTREVSLKQKDISDSDDEGPWPSLHHTQWRWYVKTHQNISYHTDKLGMKAVEPGLRNMSKQVQ